jgi:hypothetical protein
MRTATLASFVIAVGSLSCLAEQPIVPGSPEAVDRGLLGIWRCVFPDEEYAAKLTVEEVDGRRIRAELAGGDHNVWFAYRVTFEGKRLLNVQFTGDMPRQWTVARYTLYRPTVLHIEAVSYDNESLKSATTAPQRTAALRRGLKDKTPLEDASTCTRIKE